jgi:hypothetical protein
VAARAACAALPRSVPTTPAARRRGGGARRATAAALLVVVAVACGSRPTASERAVEALVAARGMDRHLARCLVAGLGSRGVDPAVVGDGRIVVAEQPVVIEILTLCAAALATGR